MNQFIYLFFFSFHLGTSNLSVAVLSISHDGAVGFILLFIRFAAMAHIRGVLSGIFYILSH